MFKVNVYVADELVGSVEVPIESINVFRAGLVSKGSEEGAAHLNPEQDFVDVRLQVRSATDAVTNLSNIEAAKAEVLRNAVEAAGVDELPSIKNTEEVPALEL